jgi:hypothetical protein
VADNVQKIVDQFKPAPSPQATPGPPSFWSKVNWDVLGLGFLKPAVQPTDPDSEILQDVKEGDRLVTNPAVDLSEGAVVTAKPLSKRPAPTLANPTTKA